MPKESTQPDEFPEAKEILDFRNLYAQALSHARISEEHTATEGWQNLYAANRDTVRKSQDDWADRLDEVTKILRQRLLSEDEEKAIGDIRKALAELRERDQAFQRHVIDPIISPMVECNAVIEGARAVVRDAQRNAPLHTRGLLEAMEDAINGVPRVKFMTASGRLMVSE